VYPTTGQQHYHLTVISSTLDPQTKKTLAQSEVKIGKYSRLYGAQEDTVTADRAAKRKAEQVASRYGGSPTRIGTAAFMVITGDDRMISLTGFLCEIPSCKLGL
jgi:hypothetical protein